MSDASEHGRGRKAAALATTILAIAMAGGTGVAYGGGGIGTGGGGSDAEGVFPVRGNFSYGDGLGAGRGHQGQDILANCGKPIVAAQQGRIQLNKYQASGAGNYVVIDGKGKLKDTVYMHMKKRSKFRAGDKVDAGEQIGVVGLTGRTTGCHLHFEMWSNPGWYEGGHAVDPKPSLKRWARAK